MADYQNNMRSMRRPVRSSFSSSQTCPRRMDGCPDTRDFFPDDIPLAMAYVRWQRWQDVYEPCKAFQHGTIFMELDKPFLGQGGKGR